MEPGIYALDAATYHADPSWGSSSLKAMRKGPPARVIWNRDNPTDTAARGLGTAAHCAILEPEKFATTYAHKPDEMSFATKEGKAWRNEFAGRGFTILTHEEWIAVEGIRAGVIVKTLPLDAIMRAEAIEPSLFWLDALTNEPCKGRPDFHDATHLYDLKVSRYAGPEMAYWAFLDGWMHQLAHYRSGASALGLGDLGGRLIVVSAGAPHYCWTMEVKPDALDLLAIENNQTVFALAHHRKTGIWPDAPDCWTPIEPPANALIGSVLDNMEEVNA